MIRSILFRGSSVAALALGASFAGGGTAFANCSASGGTPAAPAAGSVVTCDAIAPYNGNIGSFAVVPPDAVTINLQNNAQVIGSPGMFPISTPTIVLGNNANITVGQKANLVGTGKGGSISVGNNLALLLQSGAQVTGNVSAGNDAKITVMSGANLVGAGKGGTIQTGDRLALLLQSGGSITGPVYAGQGSSLTIGGHLIAGTPTNVSIGLAGTGNRVTLTPGYNIDGLVYGANYIPPSAIPPLPGSIGPRDPASVLAFGGDGTAGFDVSKIDTQYINFGQLEKTGTSTFVFTGTTNAALPLAVNGGTVQLDGASLAATPTTVNAGGTLSGTGTVGATSIVGGILSPGAPNKVGALAVVGPLSFTQNSTYRIAVSQTDASRTTVSGAAAVAGTVVVQRIGGGAPASQRYTILTAAGGVTGAFQLAVNSNLAFYTPTLAYDANNVFLDSAYNYVLAGATQNQRNVGSGLNNAAAGSQTPTGRRILGALHRVQIGQAGAVLDSLSGEGITAAQNVANRSTELFTSSIFDQTTFYGAGPTANSLTLFDPTPIRELADLPSSKVQPSMPVIPNRTWRAWATGFGGVDDIHGNGQIGSSYQQNTIYGGTLGVDYQLLPNYLIGVAVGGTNGDFLIPGRATSGSTTGGHVAFYDLATFGSFYGASSTSFSYFGNRATRTVSGFGGLGSETERANFNSNEFRTRLEFGRHLAGYGGVLTPFVALELAELRSNGFTENAVQGAGLFRLNVSGQSQASAPAFVGVRLQRVTSIGNGITLSPTLQVAYVHEFAPYRSQIGTIADLPGSTFLVDGARPSRNAAQVKAGAEMAIGARSVVFANFDGDFSGVNQLYAGKGGFRYLW